MKFENYKLQKDNLVNGINEENKEGTIMKNFITMSRKQAIGYTYKPISEDYIIISINEMDMKPVKFNRNNHLKDVLYLCFDDIKEETEGYTVMSHQDAFNIIQFIDKYPKINNVIIHCTAGISRSVSIRCALEECYNNRKIGEFIKEIKYDEYKEIDLKEMLKDKDDTVYIFNKLCYDKIKFVYNYLEFRNQCKDRPDLFVEKFLGVKLLPFQKILLRNSDKLNFRRY